MAAASCADFPLAGNCYLQLSSFWITSYPVNNLGRHSLSALRESRKLVHDSLLCGCIGGHSEAIQCEGCRGWAADAVEEGPGAGCPHAVHLHGGQAGRKVSILLQIQHARLSMNVHC